MHISSVTSALPTMAGQDDVPESAHSGVMWSPIIGGSLTITIVSLLLFYLIAALGFMSLSPWGMNAAHGKTFAISGAIALIVMQWFSAGLGGYLTGRLRTKYAGAHSHEVFFRDTVHGFLAWALAALIAIPVLAFASMHGMQQGHGASFRDYGRTPAAHYADLLFAGSPNSVPQNNLTEHDHASAEYVLESEAMGGSTTQEDRIFLAQLVSSRTGLSDADAERRVDDVLAQEKTAADAMRKHVAASLLFVFFSMMIGAFIASVGGALGGAHRDLHYTTGKLVE